MAEATIVSVDPPLAMTGDELDASIPPLDCDFFSQQLIDQDGSSGGPNDVAIEDLDLDFSFDDLWLPSVEDLDDFLNPATQLEFDSQAAPGSDFHQFPPIHDQIHAGFESNSVDWMHASGDGDSSGDRSSNGSRALNSSSPELESQEIYGYLNVSFPESNEFDREISGNRSGDEKVINCLSSDSQDSGNCGSNASVDFHNSVTSSPDSNTSSIRAGAVNHKIELEEPSKNKVTSSFLKRKSDCDDFLSNSVESRIDKCKKSTCNPEDSTHCNNVGSSDDDKRKVRLMRNRESAQLSRQRKKQYVEELEDKVKRMHSTIQDLNVKISYFMAENTTLRQQMGGAGGGDVPPVTPLAPGMYPYPVMPYPWMPCAPPYMMKPQGSQVPLVPIPRLKSQQPAQASKTSKKPASKKSDKKKEGPKTKKVAGISFIGLLFFIILFGGLAPLVNVRYGGVREALTGGESYVGGGFHGKHQGTVLWLNATAHDSRSYLGCQNNVHYDQRDHGCERKLSDDEFVRLGNGSEPLVASLYVPRNDKLVKIDGNLIIHSVLASEKALSSHGEGDGTGTGTGLAVPGDLSTDVPVRGVGRNVGRHSHLRTLASGSTDEDSRKTKATNGRLQEWFREGLSGPMLSSGMCTEVLQFDMSPPSASGAIVSSPATRNISQGQNKNSTHLSKRVSRRILRGLPIALPDSSHNMTGQHSEGNSPKNDLTGNISTPPMVVSILVDAREAADADGGVMGTKPISRIFVVVLMDSVKYVTYSCMLPFKGAVQHLVTA